VEAYIEVTKQDRSQTVGQVVIGTLYTDYLKDFPSIFQINLLMVTNIIITNADKPFTPSQRHIAFLVENWICCL